MTKVRVLCYSPCRDDEVTSRGRAILDTWGKRCNKLLLFTTNNIKGYPTVALQTNESNKHDLSGKMFAAMRYIYKHHLNDYDWFLKADTDTYIIMENLKYMLAGYNANKPLYFGKHFVKQFKDEVSHCVVRCIFHELIFSVSYCNNFMGSLNITKV